MNLGKLNKTVILIDTDYLNQKIKENIEFYRDLYTDKDINTINSSVRRNTSAREVQFGKTNGNRRMLNVR